ncbi:hypothetical protein [Rhizobium straminoryzae]|uniref:Uncharacterized protein n=1 Tax=Rhizobium straminoryzae TaxID=1387186 RepID=A0A549T107_9HYPH|nr:hypothetical protein [Rhizobium straminoryzae]TRL35498.1 hypothetical protein FNA46_20060 [Rhizobium straminoryzae]
MDLDAIRSSLPSMTREALGEHVTIHPMQEGKMGAAADPGRTILTGFRGRFDISPEIEQMGGGRERPQAARIVSAHATISFALSDLDNVPRTGDVIIRAHPQTGTPERYRIHGDQPAVGGVVLFQLSRIS